MVFRYCLYEMVPCVELHHESVSEGWVMRGVPAIDRSRFESSIGDQHRRVRDVLHVPGELLRVRWHARPIYVSLGVRRVWGGFWFHKERIRDTDRGRCERHVRLPCRLLHGQHRS